MKTKEVLEPLAILGILALFPIVPRSCTNVEEGHIGVVRNLAFRVQDNAKTYQPGFHYSHAWENVVDVPNPEKKSEGDIKGYTSDKKPIYFNFTVNYQLTDEGAKYVAKELNVDNSTVSFKVNPKWGDVLVVPTVQEIIKRHISDHKHADIIDNQPAFTKTVSEEINEALEKKGVILKKFLLPYTQEQGTRQENFFQTDDANANDGNDAQSDISFTANTYAPKTIVKGFTKGRRFTYNRESKMKA